MEWPDVTRDQIIQAIRQYDETHPDGWVPKPNQSEYFEYAAKRYPVRTVVAEAFKIAGVDVSANTNANAKPLLTKRGFSLGSLSGASVTGRAIGDLLQRVLDLQQAFQASRSSEMEERGAIVRSQLPNLLRQHFTGWETEGSNGVGSNSRVPWVRIFDPLASPRPTSGYYLVFLFDSEGSCVYLSLNMGSTAGLKGRPKSELLRAAESAREILAPGEKWPYLSEIKLVTRGGNELGASYEAANVAALRYESGHMPGDHQILADIDSMLALLQKLGDPIRPIPRPTQRTWLLAWNPKNYHLDNLKHATDRARAGVEPSHDSIGQRWSVGGTKSIKPGDRLFLVKVGRDPRGLVGVATAKSGVYQAEHFDPSRTGEANYVDLEWERLLDPDKEVLSLEVLRSRVDPAFRWTPQSSGIEIKAPISTKLEEVWADYVAALGEHKMLVGYGGVNSRNNTLHEDPAPTRVTFKSESKSKPQLYSLENACEDLFLSNEQVHEILALAVRKKNIVLQGPPGVGKTFVAERLAYALVGAKDKDRVGRCQFHQSYSYEDFVQGFRPKAGGGFALENGLFYDFCEAARTSPDDQYVFIIDEINRGNLSKILGEVLSLIETDKRGTLEANLAYSKVPFSVPANIIVIGLMNTADRSLAVVDYALRRRFAFIEIQPAFDNPKFGEYLAQHQVTAEMVRFIAERIGNLNKKITSDRRNLGNGFEIGHSFFCPNDPIPDEVGWYQDVIKYEIEPLLREYWFDAPEKADDEVIELRRPLLSKYEDPNT